MVSKSKLYLFWLRFWCLAPFLLRNEKGVNLKRYLYDLISKLAYKGKPNQVHFSKLVDKGTSQQVPFSKMADKYTPLK